MTSRNIVTRLAKVEQSVSASGSEGGIRLYYCQGPVGMDGHEYLQSLGYDLPDNAFVITFVDAIDGRPVDSPLADLTPQYAPENALTEFGA